MCMWHSVCVRWHFFVNHSPIMSYLHYNPGLIYSNTATGIQDRTTLSEEYLDCSCGWFTESLQWISSTHLLPNQCHACMWGRTLHVAFHYLSHITNLRCESYMKQHVIESLTEFIFSFFYQDKSHIFLHFVHKKKHFDSSSYTGEQYPMASTRGWYNLYLHLLVLFVVCL